MFLNEIVESTRQRLAAVQETFTFPFEQALRQPGISFICEVKKASPSKGVIAEDFPYMEIARQYEAAGAAAISVLTEPDYFKGSPRFLQEISAQVGIPCLRKDFIISPYQIFEAKQLGAAAVLLIAEILDEETLGAFIRQAHSLGLSALVESHSGSQLEKALRAGARVVGVNNRNLESFEVDLSASLRLRERVPKEVLFVAESGIRSPEDVQKLRECGADAVLVGETLMRSANKTAALARLRGKTK